MFVRKPNETHLLIVIQRIILIQLQLIDKKWYLSIFRIIMSTRTNLFTRELPPIRLYLSSIATTVSMNKYFSTCVNWSLHSSKQVDLFGIHSILPK